MFLIHIWRRTDAYSFYFLNQVYVQNASIYPNLTWTLQNPCARKPIISSGSHCAVTALCCTEQTKVQAGGRENAQMLNLAAGATHTVFCLKGPL